MRLIYYSNKNEIDFNTPFWTFNSGILYSFINAGRTVNGLQVSATIAIATVVIPITLVSVATMKVVVNPVALVMTIAAIAISITAVVVGVTVVITWEEEQ